MASGFQFVLLLSGLLALASCCEEKHDCPASCPPGWTQFGCHCYLFHLRGKNWPDAERYCQSVGGNLAPVHNADEHNFIRGYILRVSGGFHVTWIGATDAVKEGQWMWSDGSSFDYSPWYTGQPANSGGNEHCVEMNYGGTYWNDRICTVARPFICAKDAKHSLCCPAYGGGH